jgi:L-serine dehydratase
MRNNYISMFDIIGPVMVGPSSSHTSGAAAIAWMARQILSGVPVHVTFTLYGSFADTYQGHGTDRALIGGMLGYRPDDIRIRKAFEEAREAGLDVEFVVDKEEEMPHPNTVGIDMTTADGHTLYVRGESIGGGRIRITRMNDIRVDFNGDYSMIIVGHRDEPGMMAFMTGCLAERRINIASMKSFRNARGKQAFTIIETDDFIPDAIQDELNARPGITSVDIIQL